MCDEPAAANPFALYLHRAVMSSLTPGAVYRYSVGGAASGGSPGSGSFRAAPREGGGARVSFIAFGDLGDPVHAAAASPGAAATLATMARRDARDTNLILHVGDLSYGGGRARGPPSHARDAAGAPATGTAGTPGAPPRYQQARPATRPAPSPLQPPPPPPAPRAPPRCAADGDPDIWDSFMDAIEPIASRVPWMIAVGNHEVGYSSKSGAEIDPSGLGPYAPSWVSSGQGGAQGMCSGNVR